MKPSHIQTLFEQFETQNPNPETELEYGSVFQLLIAVILSAQATDVSVNKATPALFAAAPTPEAFLALGEEGLISYIKTIGLFRSKARHVMATCQKLVTEHGGEVPSTREALEALPGVGRKTANIILNSAFGEPTIAVDTHIFRISNRLGLSDGATPLAVEKDLTRCIPQRFQKKAHHWLVLHGRYVCTARKPRCHQCFASTFCPSADKNSLV